MCNCCLQVEQLLPKGVDSIPQLSVALVTISKALDSEMAAMPAHEVIWVLHAARLQHHAATPTCLPARVALAMATAR
jgi:hypothetical protein